MRKSVSAPDPNSIPKAYLFTGEVDSRRTDAVNKLVASYVSPDSQLFDLERFSGDSTSAESILSAVMTMPFGSERKVIIVDWVDRLSAVDQCRIADFIPKLGAQSCLILLSGDENPTRRKSIPQSKQSPTETEDDDEDPTAQKKPEKGLQSALTAAVKKHGSLATFPKMKSEDVYAQARQMIQAQGKKIEPAAMQAFVYSMQSIPQIMEREVEKLAAYTGDRTTITAADVEEVTTRSPEDKIFALIDAVAAGRADAALHLLNGNLLANAKEDGEVLRALAMLGKHFRMLYQVKYLLSQGVRRLIYTASEEPSEMPTGGGPSEELRARLMKEANPLSAHDFQKKKFMEQVSCFTLEELRNCLRHVLTCELAVKGQSRATSSSRLSMETMILKLSDRKSLVRAR